MWLLRLRYSLRSLARDPAFVLIVVMVFSLGVAANTLLLTVIDQIVLHPLPYRDPDGLVMIWEANPSLDEPQASRGRVAWNNFREWQTQTDVFDAIEAYEWAEYNLTGRGNPEHLVAARASTGFFRMLGVPAQVGRTFLPEDAGSNSIVLVTAAFAKNHFGRQNPLGEKLLLNGIPHAIVGVLPGSFHLMAIFEGAYEYKPEIWVPLPPVTAADPPTETRVRRFLVTVRLKRGVTLAQARAEMRALATRLEQSDPGLNTGYSVNLVPLKIENADPDLGRALDILLAAAFTVLLLGCLNGSGLMLVRFINRQRDLAIMDALGAPKHVLIANVLTESLMLAVVSATLAWGACYAGIGLIRALQPISIYGASRLHLDMRSFVASGLISLLCVSLLGVLPAWLHSRRTFKSSLRQAANFGGARWGSLVRRILVSSEIALTLVLAIGAMLLTRSFQRLLEVDPGWFRAQNLVTGRIVLVPPRYAGDDDREQFSERLLDRVRRLPGVEIASLADNFPFHGLRYNWFEIEGRAIAKPGSAPSADYAAVTSDFFQTMGTPLRRGRLFTGADMQSGATQVAILNETLARKYWPNQDPIGAHIRLMPPHRDPGPWRVVVGVVGDYHQFNIETPARPQMFWPARQFSEMTVVARTTNDPAATLAALPKVVAELDKDQPVADVQTLQYKVDYLNSQYRFNMLVLSALAGLGIVLALGGVYGLISYVISSHQRDLGIRLALGAQRKHVFYALLRQILPFAAIGVGLGLLLSLLTKKLIADLLFEINAFDPATYIALPIALMTLAVLTCALPAWRASRMDPVKILRQE
ncbi:MAG TPA: ABC transporter permease [Candidatus Dormibacteraeota bacterium]|jgi:predicted permease|nr:ABC transporter permease [Candidatus Dormibacteraeota bacterium]